jgi:hypothetical protein
MPTKGQESYMDVKSNFFLRSYEWRMTRMLALKKYGTTCMCCGATQQMGVRICVDHIKPRKLFPELALELSNLQILCEDCNHGKANWDQTDWRKFGIRVPEMGETPLSPAEIRFAVDRGLV